MYIYVTDFVWALGLERLSPHELRSVAHINTLDSAHSGTCAAAALFQWSARKHIINKYVTELCAARRRSAAATAAPQRSTRTPQCDYIIWVRACVHGYVYVHKCSRMNR